MYGIKKSIDKLTLQSQLLYTVEAFLAYNMQILHHNGNFHYVCLYEYKVAWLYHPWWRI